MVQRWKCPKCGTLNCMCKRSGCILCGEERPERPEVVEYTPRRAHP